MILVTGGLGMIGAHTAHALADQGRGGRRHHPPPHRGPVVPRRQRHGGALDVTDRDAFVALGERHDISGIVHLAGSIPARTRSRSSARHGGPAERAGRRPHWA